MLLVDHSVFHFYSQIDVVELHVLSFGSDHCGRSKVCDWSELKADGKDEKSEGRDDQSETSDDLTHNLKWLMWMRRFYMRKIKYGRQFKS